MDLYIRAMDDTQVDYIENSAFVPRADEHVILNGKNYLVHHVE